MVQKPVLRDLLIFLPGIMGSVLRQGSQRLWDCSGIALSQYLLDRFSGRFGERLDVLAVVDDDWERPLDDGVVAEELIPDVHHIPKIGSHAGYSPVLRAIRDSFAFVEEGSLHNPRSEANFFPFPYDWRRDNRATAKALAAFIAEQLPRYREASGNSNAGVILVAHSMGGLAARYYVECLEGWKTTRALITVGTPHRGSVEALLAICNGVLPNPWVDFSAVARNFTSLYQLLPLYPCIVAGGQASYLTEHEGLPYLDHGRVKAARAFHEQLFEAAPRNRRQREEQVLVTSWVGVHQDTVQSVHLDDGVIRGSFALPPGIEATSGGDGVVPRLSAIPADLSPQQARDFTRFAAEYHGWLTNADMTLTPLIEHLTDIVGPNYQGKLGAQGRPDGVALGMFVEPVVPYGEPVVVHVQMPEGAARRGTTRHQAELTFQPRGGGAMVRRTLTIAPGEPSSCEVGLQPGLYEVTATVPFHGRPNAVVHRLVEVTPQR